MAKELDAEKAYNSTELAALYGVSRYIFLKWIKPIRKELGEQIARTWTPKQVKIITTHLDPP